MSGGVNPRKVALIREYIGKGRVLDLGCGNGLYGMHLEEAAGEVLQVDVADRRVPEARRFPFLEANVMELDYGSVGAKSAVAFDLIEHLDDDAQLLSLMRPAITGRLIISVPNADDSIPYRIALTHLHKRDKTHRREYSPESLRAVLEKTGYRVIGVFPNHNNLVWTPAWLLSTTGSVSRAAAKVISLQCRLLGRLGIFRNQCIADWFCVAE
jgi:predicted TPR repeat methyltransferase